MKMTNNLCTQRRWWLRGRVSGVREWNGNTSAATWQDEKRAGDGGRWWSGVWERVGVALESRMGDTSLPAAAVRGKGTQGLLFPLRSLFPGRSLVFPQQTMGTMKAACSPPLMQKGCQYWTYQTLNGRISLPMKLKSMTCFPWLSSLWSGWQL